MLNQVTDVEIRWAGIFSVARVGWLTPKRAALEADLWLDTMQLASVFGCDTRLQQRSS